MDSAALLWWRRPEMAIFIDYGQRPANAERAGAEAVAREAGVPLETIAIDLSPIGSGSLTVREALPIAPSAEWWPYRNQLLVTMAAAVALQRNMGIDTILIGSVLEDRLNRDGTREFRDALDTLLRQQEGGIGLDAPASALSSVDLVRTSAIPPRVLGWTHSCFISNVPCLKCRGCRKHLGVLDELGLRWPSARSCLS
jgi:7-cyano-7-deazaguanine synthase